MSRLVAVLGPTASGKSALGMALAEHLGGEIVSCDSMQVYRGLDVGTAKPTAAERARVPHHMIDLVAPDEPFHAARFAELAHAAVLEIESRGKLPILVGGTGLYYRAFVRGLFDAPPSDAAIRARHRDEAARHGVPALHARLTAIDAAAAAGIMPNDLLRTSRALEVFEQTGSTLTALRARTAPHRVVDPWAVLLDPPMAQLRERIALRVQAMLDAGFLDEVRRLRAAGLGASRPLSALGYKQLGEHLEGRLAWADVGDAITKATAAYARRQKTWFRRETIAWRVEGPPRLDEVMAAWTAAVGH